MWNLTVTKYREPRTFGIYVHKGANTRPDPQKHIVFVGFGDNRKSKQDPQGMTKRKSIVLAVAESQKSELEQIEHRGGAESEVGRKSKSKGNARKLFNICGFMHNSTKIKETEIQKKSRTFEKIEQ